MPAFKYPLAAAVLIATGLWCPSGVLGQAHRILQPPSVEAKSPNSGKRASSESKARDIDVFELGETTPLTVVEVEQVDYESTGGPSLPPIATNSAGVAVGQEFVVGGGGIPTGTYLEDGRWVEDGAVINDESMDLLGPHGDGSAFPGATTFGGAMDDYGAWNDSGLPYAESFPQEHLRPRGARVSPLWVRADLLAWSLDGTRVPALLSTSPAGTARADAGVLGEAGTTVLFGNQTLGDDFHTGGRVEVGGWLASRSLGWHLAYFGLDSDSDDNRFDSNGTSILARPYFSVDPNAIGPNADLLAFPGQLAGSASVSSSTQLDGAEVFFHRMLASDGHRQLQLVGGFQTNSLQDDLSITDFRRVLVGTTGSVAGTTLSHRDLFQTDNRFAGAAVGVLANIRRQRLTIDLGMQMALGNNHSKVRIDGSTTSSVPVTALASEVVTTRGGLLAQPSNIGEYELDAFTMVPQLHADLGFDVYPHLRLMLGYRFLYWSQVARAGEQIDTSLNLTQSGTTVVGGESRPGFDYRLTDFWAQGVSLGLDYRF